MIINIIVFIVLLISIVISYRMLNISIIASVRDDNLFILVIFHVFLSGILTAGMGIYVTYMLLKICV